MTRVLPPLLLCLSAVAVVGQDPVRIAPARWFVSLKEEVPTHREVAARLRARLLDGVVTDLREGAALTARDSVVLLGDGDTDTGAARRIVLGVDVTLAISPSRVWRAVDRLLPDVRRIAVLGDPEAWPGVADQVVGIADAGAVAAAACDAVLVPDDPQLLGEAEAVVLAAQRRGLPAITTAPWLARSCCAVGVVPDLEAAALKIARLLRGKRVPLAAVPTETTVHLGAWRRTGLEIRPDRIAWAHRIHGGSP